MEVKELVRLVRRNVLVDVPEIGKLDIFDIVRAGKDELIKIHKELVRRKIELESSVSLFDDEENKEIQKELEDVERLIELVRLVAEVIKEDEKRRKLLEEKRKLEELLRKKMFEELSYEDIVKKLEEINSMLNE